MMIGTKFSALKILTTCMVVWLMFSGSFAQKRKLKTTFWPDCDEKDFIESCKIARSLGDNVVYTKASTQMNDNLYYVFSTIGIPSILLARATGADTDLMFDWNKLMNGSIENSISFKEAKGLKVDYMYAVAFTRLIEYNDTQDAADLYNKKLKPENFLLRNFTEFFWDTLPRKSNGTNEFVFKTTSDFLPPEKSNNGSLSFSFKVIGENGRASALPALGRTSNMTQFDFVLDNYTPSFAKSRFALEAVLVSLSKNKDMRIAETESIDDEYCPGVFTINNWLSNPGKQSASGFLQWKPVSYNSEDRGRKSATKVKHYKIVDIRDRDQQMEQVKSSVVEALFGDVWKRSDVIIKSSNISFGLSKDDFYTKNNYTVWSSSVGYGTPPRDAISTTVIAIIAAGLGIPVILIIFGGIYTVLRRMRGRSDYQPINNDSLNRNNPQ